MWIVPLCLIAVAASFLTEIVLADKAKQFTSEIVEKILRKYVKKNPVGAHPVKKDPDVGKDMVEITQIRGYHLETHYVTTSDGYILTMFNIPHGKSESKRNSKPVILQHGLLDCSYTWVNNYEDQSLGFILAENGFDVWFGNNRGNRYGRNHTTLNPDDEATAAQFWTFSWDEMASLDAPAMINYVSKVTNVNSIGWVGHSEGTTQMFAAGSLMGKNEAVNAALSKVNLFVALAPVTSIRYITSVVLLDMINADTFKKALDKGIREFWPYGVTSDELPVVCQLDSSACNTLYESLMGPSKNLNETRYQVYVSQNPSGTSMLNMDHWAQGARTENFQMYDYGAEGNSKRYGQFTPPLYDLSQFGLKVAMFSGTNDALADVKDVQRMMEQLPRGSVVYSDIQPDYAHCDFSWAFNANQRIYPKIVELLNEYAN